MASASFETFEREQVEQLPSEAAFGWVIGGILGLLSLKPLLHGRTPHLILLGLAGSLCVAAWLRPGVLRPLNRAWMRLGLLLGRIVNPLVLGAVFVLAITPISFLMRLCGKRPLDLHFLKDASSYWIAREPQARSRESMRYQF